MLSLEHWDGWTIGINWHRPGETNMSAIILCGQLPLSNWRGPSTCLEVVLASIDTYVLWKAKKFFSVICLCLSSKIYTINSLFGKFFLSFKPSIFFFFAWNRAIEIVCKFKLCIMADWSSNKLLQVAYPVGIYCYSDTWEMNYWEERLQSRVHCLCTDTGEDLALEGVGIWRLV